MNAENLNADLRGDQKPEASDAQASAEMRDFPRLPEHAIPIVPVRNLVLFPGIILPLTVGRKQSVAAPQEATREERPIGVVLQRNAEAESPTPDDLHWVGTVANVVRYITGRDGTHHVICQGEQRFRVTQFIEGYPFLVGRIERIEEQAQTSREIEARMLQLKERVVEALQLLPQPPEELGNALQGVQSASALADLSAHFMDLKPAEKQDILETFDVQARLDKVLAFLAHRLEVLRLSRDIGQRTKESMDKRQREYLLREQLKAIQKELGETDQNAAEVAELSQAITEAKMPAETDEHARKELRRLERMPEAAAEYSMVRTYLEWLTELPWSILTDSTIDIAEARKILDEDHYGLAKIKRRILEYLAVRKLNPEGKSPILCFIGPPGVGTMRGVRWAICYLDPLHGQLSNHWVHVA